MHLHESVFWGIVFFLVGIFLAPSIRLAALAIITIVGAGVAAYRGGSKRIAWFAALVSFVVIGAMYWVGYNVHQKNKTVTLIGKRATITGHVLDVRRSEKSQRVVIKLNDVTGGKISVMARPYPMLRYGDVITASGAIKKPDEKNRMYLLKDAIFATMQFPEIKLVKQNDGNKKVINKFDW